MDSSFAGFVHIRHQTAAWQLFFVSVVWWKKTKHFGSGTLSGPSYHTDKRLKHMLVIEAQWNWNADTQTEAETGGRKLWRHGREEMTWTIRRPHSTDICNQMLRRFLTCGDDQMLIKIIWESVKGQRLLYESSCDVEHMMTSVIFTRSWLAGCFINTLNHQNQFSPSQQWRIESLLPNLRSARHSDPHLSLSSLISVHFIYFCQLKLQCEVKETFTQSSHTWCWFTCHRTWNTV